MVALDPLFPRFVLGRALHALCATHPSVAFRILSTPMGAAIEALRQDACTFAITAADLPDARIELEALMEISCAAVVAVEHPLAIHARTQRPATVSDLADHIQIVAEDPSDLTEGRDYGVLSPVTWRVADNAIKLDLILAAIGWASLPLWSIERELASGALLRLPVAAFGSDGETRTQASIAHRTDRPLGPAARALRANLIEAVAEEKRTVSDGD